MGTETALLVVIVVLGVLLVVVAAVFLNAVKGLKGSVSGLTRRIEQLQSEVDKQGKQLDLVQAALRDKPHDPFAAVLETLQGYRSRGVPATLGLVAARLVKGFFNGRSRRKALPPPK